VLKVHPQDLTTTVMISMKTVTVSPMIIIRLQRPNVVLVFVIPPVL